jgi:polyisoprenyl-phosphate glycosyltransferase
LEPDLNGYSRSATLSVVIATERNEVPSVQVLESLLRATVAHFSMVELVIVANGVDAPAMALLEQLIAQLPDVTVHVLIQHVERDAAVLFGVDNALGDWVLVVDAEADQVREIPAMVGLAHDNIDGILVGPRPVDIPRRMLYDLGANLLVKTCRNLTSIPFERSNARIRMMNRALCMRILGDVHSGLLLRWLPSETAFRVEHRTGAYALPEDTAGSGTLMQSVGRAFGVLTRSSGIPLRVLSLVSAALALLSFLNPFYVFAIYLFKPDVMPGWATISLQLSALTLVVSLMFLMIAEYLILIRSAMPPRRRVAVARELRSTKTATRSMLNVVDHQGVFHGAVAVSGSRAVALTQDP